MSVEPEGASAWRTRGAEGAAPGREVSLIKEEPLLLVLGDERLLTMRTPGADEDLALGFLLAERVVLRKEDVLALAAFRRGDPGAPRGEDGRPPEVDVVQVTLASKSALGKGRLSRAHEIRPSCGLCGAASAEGLTQGLTRLAPGRPRTSVAKLRELGVVLRSRQTLFEATGGAHAAGLFDLVSQELLALGEDVGRHNAVDKALGRAAREGRDFSRAALLLSGRAGFELVLKALRLEVPVVASVSAPTSLAVEIADEVGATLVGFLREEGEPRVYTDDGRLG